MNIEAKKAVAMEQVVPMAQELSDENLDLLFGGLMAQICGCGWLCSYTGECGCSNGHSICGC